jgi:hypothetical protein
VSGSPNHPGQNTPPRGERCYLFGLLTPVAVLDLQDGGSRLIIFRFSVTLELRLRELLRLAASQ